MRDRSAVNRRGGGQSVRQNENVASGSAQLHRFPMQVQPAPTKTGTHSARPRQVTSSATASHDGDVSGSQVC